MILKKKRVINHRVILWMAVCLSSMLCVTIIVPGLLVKKIPDNGAPPPIHIAKNGLTEETITEQGLMIPGRMRSPITVTTSMTRLISKS